MEAQTNNWIYFKFHNLPQVARDKFNIKSPNRLDCVSIYNPDDYKGLTFFVNNKGQMYLYRTLTSAIVQTDPMRQANFMLTGKSINLSSIYNDLHRPGFGYGNPPHSKMLGRKRNKPNPLYTWRDDLYLFIFNPDYTEIELIIIPDGKNLWNT